MVVKHVNLKDKTTPQAKIPRPNSDWNWIQRSNCGDSVASHHPSDDWSLGSSLHAGVDECAYMILAMLNCIYNSRSPSKITVINLTKVSETASNYCIRVAPAKGQSLKIWDDSSIDALIEAFTQVQTLQTAWKSHRCQALIEVLEWISTVCLKIKHLDAGLKHFFSRSCNIIMLRLHASKAISHVGY